MDAGALDQSLEVNIAREIRNAVPRGIVLTNNASADSHNPLDRQLEVYSYVKLRDIDPALEGLAKITISCRLSLSDGSLSLRTISRNFNAE